MTTENQTVQIIRREGGRDGYNYSSAQSRRCDASSRVAQEVWHSERRFFPSSGLGWSLCIDADVIFAGAASPSEHSASLVILRLAEITLIEARTSQQAIIEAERNLKQKLPQTLPALQEFAGCNRTIPIHNSATTRKRSVIPTNPQFLVAFRATEGVARQNPKDPHFPHSDCWLIGVCRSSPIPNRRS